MYRHANPHPYKVYTAGTRTIVITKPVKGACSMLPSAQQSGVSEYRTDNQMKERKRKK